MSWRYKGLRAQGSFSPPWGRCREAAEGVLRLSINYYVKKNKISKMKKMLKN